MDTDAIDANKNPTVPRNIFLFQCHFVSTEIIREFNKLRQSTAHLGRAVILFHNESGKAPSAFQSLPVIPFTLSSLADLGYSTIGPSLIPDHIHFPLLRFFLNQPDYDYYWIIESDVRFSGKWRSFFDAFQNISADYLAGHIRTYPESPKWQWWSIKHPKKSIPLPDRLASFNPLCRLSNNALAHLHRELVSGWRGHQEVIMPTLLYQNDFSIADIGGRSRFTPPDMTDRFYLSGPPDPKGRLTRSTLRYRPPFRRAGRIPNKLYHPVKPLTQVIRWHLSPQAVQFGLTAFIDGLFRKV